MGYVLNTTDDYHVHQLNTLGWELTVVNALEPTDSPCRGALQNPASFGQHLCRFLEDKIALTRLRSVLEVGGGMGYLMKDLLTRARHIKATMLDISPYLLQKQKDALAAFPVNFREMDFLKTGLSDLQSFDLAILNENLGDFPTLVFEPNLPDHPAAIRPLQRARDYQKKYALEFSPTENINIGALEALEKLCGAGIPYIYLSEHSCEASFTDPSYPHLHFTAPGRPERIALRGHSEFTVKFSRLASIAKAFHYRVFRGPYIDILPIRWTDKVQAALRSAVPFSDKQEVLQHFIYDLHKYEYMLLINDGKRKDDL